ncbi:NAD(P)H-hydrate dehydratase [Candidatus Allofournierella merdipullorum]|uniref:NAD(P)H-hydrate dehydratase n=1 Tax=Candidatus Allofournierella merdipullorum TaxID=2838595 RepID=UPI002A8C56D2|nr:NAD(P)H-hydrate dehydratase [Candidatus Fournierella merdipullorum]
MAKEITGQQVFELLPRRKADSHKGSYGKVMCLAGSARFRGAAALAAEGALRAGAGLVTLASVEPVIAAAAARVPECVFLPCRQSAEGGVSAQSAGAVLEKVRGMDALLFGPGLGDSEDTAALLEKLGPSAGCALVLDADGLNAAAKMEALPRSPGLPLILTPHPGEMARLCGLTIAEVNAGREGIAAGYARAEDCVVVLKGHRTIVAGPQGEVFVNPTGNPGLSRGGSGDILAGMIAGLAAQGLSPLDAAVCGVWLHGAAADKCAGRLGQYGMLPHDIFADLGAIFAAGER